VYLPRTRRDLWESAEYLPHRNAHGDIVGVVALVKDVTERKQAEERLRLALAELALLQSARSPFKRGDSSSQQPPKIIGKSRAFLAALERARTVAATSASVLITGETGTGKELFARVIHLGSSRSGAPLVTVNCGALSPELIDSEFFGHVRGAFTGALQSRIGRFELATGGTIFLDEIGELPLSAQVRLLRVLQDGEIQPVGANETRRVDVRVIAATNRDLRGLVAQGAFREDLLYRLNVFPIEIPPLRQRLEDVPLLASTFLADQAQKLNKALRPFSAAELHRLTTYPWPGNVRELQNQVQRAAILAQGDEPQLELPTIHTPAAPLAMADVQRQHILDVLRASGGVLQGPSGAASKLGLKPSTLRSRMRKLGISSAR
jgi:transcriptional regulator with GAF, ATPase, and Fis domain